MSLGTDEGQKKIRVPKIVIVSATTLYPDSRVGCRLLSVFEFEQ